MSWGPTPTTCAFAALAARRWLRRYFFFGAAVFFFAGAVRFLVSAFAFAAGAPVAFTVAGFAPRFGVSSAPTAVMTVGRSATRTVRCAVRFTTRNARPIGAGRMRFIDGPWFA